MKLRDILRFLKAHSFADEGLGSSVLPQSPNQLKLLIEKMRSIYFKFFYNRWTICVNASIRVLIQNIHQMTYRKEYKLKGVSNWAVSQVMNKEKIDFKEVWCMTFTKCLCAQYKKAFELLKYFIKIIVLGEVILENHVNFIVYSVHIIVHLKALSVELLKKFRKSDHLPQ